MMINRWILDDPYVAHPEVPAEARTVAMHIGTALSLEMGLK